MIAEPRNTQDCRAETVMDTRLVTVPLSLNNFISPRWF
ncbi:hypothetical protein P378_15255 [Desulforamulus profundi]|uniref:Uncharacterized protein n=1 Tax=Desulforamulus profundi TaxID=1383067 RepID=A0A2C6ME49_9FIRM|nr:hypothetical protein P378_15255 [Desulforamulus profundi]